MITQKHAFGISMTLAVALFAFGGLVCTAEETAPAQPKMEEKTAYKMGEWTEDQALAFQTAKDLKLPVLMDFTGSDWCPWCVRLEKEVFSQKDFQDYAKTHFILLKLDYPNKKKQLTELRKLNATMAKKYKINGFPTIIAVDAEGNQLFRTGYRPGGAKKYTAHLEALMEDAASKAGGK